MNKYQGIAPITRREAEALIQFGSPEEISLALIRLAYHDPDWRWVQDLCISLSSHADKWVRRSSVTCFGHIARIHGVIDKDKVMPVLNRLLLDPEVKGEAEDAMGDLAVFIKNEDPRGNR